jgi:hypothetical protein
VSALQNTWAFQCCFTWIWGVRFQKINFRKEWCWKDQHHLKRKKFMKTVWQYRYVRMTHTHGHSDLISHTHAGTSQRQCSISRTHFLNASASTSCYGTHTISNIVGQQLISQQRPFLLSAYRQFIRRQEQSYAQTKKWWLPTGSHDIQIIFHVQKPLFTLTPTYQKVEVEQLRRTASTHPSPKMECPDYRSSPIWINDFNFFS